MFEAQIAASDPIEALCECARHNVPGPIITFDNGCDHMHALVLREEARESLYDWYERADSLIAAVEFLS